VEDEEKLFTSAGTDINEVKRKNAASGLSYSEVMQMLARNYRQAPKNNYNSEEIGKEFQPQKSNK